MAHGPEAVKGPECKNTSSAVTKGTLPVRPGRSVIFWMIKSQK
jgi:hypothetical protein